MSAPAVPTIDLMNEEHRRVAATVRRSIETERFPHAPRLDPLRAALAKFDAAPKLTPEPPLPKTPPGAQGGIASRSAVPSPPPAQMTKTPGREAGGPVLYPLYRISCHKT
jgi:hypothetical protein